jgi:hypothetical protein
VKTLQELEGHLTEQGVIAVLKPFTVDQLEEAVGRALPSPDQRTTSARSLVRDDERGRQRQATG